MHDPIGSLFVAIVQWQRFVAEALDIIAAGYQEIVAELRKVGGNFSSLRSDKCLGLRQGEKIGDGLEIGLCKPL